MVAGSSSVIYLRIHLSSFNMKSLEAVPVCLHLCDSGYLEEKGLCHLLFPLLVFQECMLSTKNSKNAAECNINFIGLKNSNHSKCKLIIVNYILA